MLKRFFSLLLVCLLPIFISAQETPDQRLARLDNERAAYEATTDGKINAFMSPITNAVERVIFFTIPFSSDKRIDISSDRRYNGDNILAEGERIEIVDSVMVKFTPTNVGVDESDAPEYERTALGYGNAITLSNGQNIEFKAPVRSIHADENGLFRIEPGMRVPFVLIWLI
ncbi:MAG: hypothetical protein AAFU67_16110, partial [Bacteroidota bacterium]